MAAPVLGRTPTCLSCVRRLTTAPTPTLISSTSTTWTAPASPFFSHLQVRNKSKHRYDQGVIVRLLEDIPRYGRREAIFRVDRGRMRNLWYPKNKAEYMTAQRFAELGLSRQQDVGERDFLFRAYENARDAEEVQEEPEQVEDAAAVPVFSLAPERIHALLSTLLPPTLTFHRKPIPHAAPEPEPEAAPVQKRSPLLAAHVRDLPSERKQQQPKLVEAEAQAIFGSVSTTDILSSIKSYLSLDTEAARIPLEAKSVRFLGLDEDADRVKTLGKWKVEIAVPGAADVPEVQFVRRVVEVVAAEEEE